GSHHLHDVQRHRPVVRVALDEIVASLSLHVGVAKGVEVVSWQGAPFYCTEHSFLDAVCRITQARSSRGDFAPLDSARKWGRVRSGPHYVIIGPDPI
ncbi:MAG: hypothetical protein ACXWC1_29895, partial [Burkholderiales bacterium]